METSSLSTYLWLALILNAIICAFGASAIAETKGRGSGAWFTIGLLCGPLAILIVGFMEKETPREVAEWTGHHESAVREIPKDQPDPNRIKCPVCAELIMKEARICHFCRTDIFQPEPKKSIPVAQGVEDRLREAHRFLHMGQMKQALEAYLAIAKEHPDYLPAWRCIVSTANVPQDVKDLARTHIERLTA